MDNVYRFLFNDKCQFRIWSIDRWNKLKPITYANIKNIKFKFKRQFFPHNYDFKLLKILPYIT